MPLPYKDKELLRRARFQLVQDLELRDGLYSAMYKERLINRIVEERIKNPSQDEVQRREAILAHLETGNEHTMGKFLKCLEMTEQHTLLDYLNNEMMHLENPDYASPDSTTLGASPLVLSEKDQEAIISGLTNYYMKKLKILPIVPWEGKYGRLQQLFTNLALVSEEPRGGQTKRIILQNHHEIFKPLKYEESPPKHVHIIGEAGVGKSTLMAKLAIEWAEQGHSQSSKSANFIAAFLIRLRTVTEDTCIEKIIKQQLFSKEKDVTDYHIAAFLEKHKHEVLFLIDGYDEYGNKSTDMNELILGNKYFTSTVLVTSRPTRMPPSGPSRDRLVEVTGFDKDKQSEYIQKFFDEEDLVGMKLQKEIKSKSLQHMTRIPILLLMLCALFQELGTLPNTLTALYAQLVVFLYKRSVDKTGSMPQLTLNDILLVNGKVAWEHLLTGNLEFYVDSSHKYVHYSLEMGLIQKVQCESLDGSFKLVSFFHKSMQEFCAAWFILSARKMGELEQCCSTVASVLDMAELLKFMCNLSKGVSIREHSHKQTMKTGHATGSTHQVSQVVISQDTGVLSLSTNPAAQHKSEAEYVSACDEKVEGNHDNSMLYLGHDAAVSSALQGLVQKLNCVAAREARREETTWKKVFEPKEKLSEVWTLLMQCYKLLGQPALSGEGGGWTRDLLLYNILHTVSLVVDDSTQWKCPPAPAALRIYGDEVHVRGGVRCLSLHDGSWSAQVYTSRLALVSLWWVSLDVRGLQQLATSHLHGLELELVTVSGDQEEQEEQQPLTCSWRMVDMRGCDLSVGAGRLLARALTTTQHLQRLQVYNTKLQGTSRVWSTALAPAHLRSVRLWDVRPAGARVALAAWVTRGLQQQAISWRVRRDDMTRLQAWWTVLRHGRGTAWDRFTSDEYQHMWEQPIPSSVWPSCTQPPDTDEAEDVPAAAMESTYP